MKTGFTSTTLRSYSIRDVVDTAVKSGASVIEWGSDVHIKTEEDARLARALCDEHGIAVNAYGTYFRIGVGSADKWRDLCEKACILGAKCMRTWLGKKGSRITGDGEYASLVEHTRTLADIAGGYGLIISNECHPNTYNDTETSSLRYLTDVDRENLKTYYQSWYRKKETDLHKLTALMPYISDVHVSFSELRKFQRFHGKDPEFIKDILDCLAENNFGGNVLIEFTKSGSAENLIEDMKKLRLILNGEE